MKQVRNERFIKIVAAKLVEKFLTALGNLTGEKNYYSHIGCLSEILSWADEFCGLYYENFFHTEFSPDKFNELYDDGFLEALIISFGRKKLLDYYKENGCSNNFLFKGIHQN